MVLILINSLYQGECKLCLVLHRQGQCSTWNWYPPRLVVFIVYIGYVIMDECVCVDCCGCVHACIDVCMCVCACVPVCLSVCPPLTLVCWL